MVKTLQKSSSPGQAGRFLPNLAISIGDSCSNDDLFYGKVKFGNFGFSIGKMNTVDFSETTEACDLNVGRYRLLIDFMKVCKY